MINRTELNSLLGSFRGVSMHRDMLEITIKRIIEYSKIGCRVILNKMILRQKVCGKINKEFP